MRAARAVALAALAAGAVLVAYVLLAGGSGGHTYSLMFETGGQLVPGNEVMVGGQPIGKVDSLDLTDSGQAKVAITVEEPLHEGTTASVRATSLSGIANRYVSVAPGPDSAPEIEDGGTIASDETTAPVDLDQLFATLDEPTRRGLQDVIEGSAQLYADNHAEARETYKYLAPSLQGTQRLLAELNRDSRTFSEFLVNGADVLGAVAARRDDLSALTQNANEGLGAIAAENEALDRSLSALPPAMRQGNTTFVNLRAALDDLDPLVATAKRATRDLPGFLRNLRPVADRAVPVVGDLRLAIARPGGDNDLTDVLRVMDEVEAFAEDASREGIQAMNATESDIEFARPYAPDLLAFFTKFGQITGYYDGNGHYARLMPAVTGAFDYNEATSELEPSFSDKANDFEAPEAPPAPGGFFFPPLASPFSDIYERCPGGATQPAPPDHPFLDDGSLAGDCDPSDVPPGP